MKVVAFTIRRDAMSSWRISRVWQDGSVESSRYLSEEKLMEFIKASIDAGSEGLEEKLSVNNEGT